MNVTVTDANGNTVTQLSVEATAAGETAFEWDGKDANGNPATVGSWRTTDGRDVALVIPRGY